MFPYIYTLKDLKEADQNDLLKNAKNLRGEIGIQVKNQFFNNTITEIEVNSLDVANLMIEEQVNRENKVYKALELNKLISLQKNGNKYYIENADEIIEQIRNKLYGISNNNNSEKNALENAEKCTKILVDFVAKILDNSDLIKKNNVTKDELKEAIYEIKNLRESFVKKYGGLEKAIEDLGKENEIKIENILKVLEYFNTEINNNLNDPSKNKKGAFILYEDSGEINAGLSEDKLKQVLSTYNLAQNDYFGGIGEAGSIFLTNTIEEEVIEVKNGIEEVIGKRTIEKRTTSRWDPVASKQLRAEYEKTVGEAIRELQKTELAGELFTLDTSKSLKADEVFKIILYSNDDKIKEEITFGISNKVSGSSKGLKGALKIQDTSLKAILNNLYRVESSGYEKTKKVQENFINLLLNEAGQMAWSPNTIRYKRVEDLLKLIINYYGYVWLTGGRAGVGHADFLTFYKGEKLYFLPMSIILCDIINYTTAKSSGRINWIITGSFLKEGIISEDDLKDLDRAKRGIPVKQEKFMGKNSKGIIDSIKDAIFTEGKEGAVNKSGQLNIGSYRRLNLG